MKKTHDQIVSLCCSLSLPWQLRMKLNNCVEQFDGKPLGFECFDFFIVTFNGYLNVSLTIN